MASTTNTSVVVVGGSLVGLSTALFLRHWGVPVILLERHLASSPHPRAVGYTSRTLELLRSVDTASKLPGAIFSGPPRRISIESLAGKWREEQMWTTKPGESKGHGSAPHGSGAPGGNGKPKGLGPQGIFLEYSPTAGLGTAQDSVEPALRERALELGADLRLGYTMTSFHQDADGVTVTAVNKDNHELHISAEYVVACDGARSPIREKLGITRHGVGHLRQLRSILFYCTEIEQYFSRGYQQFQVEGRDDQFEAFVTTYGNGRIALMWNDTGDAVMNEATQKDWIRKAAGINIPDQDIQLITTGQWDIGGLVADTFSSGRIFLAGDAAHALPPNRGGYGANTGIADAHNIAWKLASVLAGKSSRELLQTYTDERQPVAIKRHDQIFLRDDYARYIQGRDWTPQNPELTDDVAMEFGQRYRSGGILGASEDTRDAARPEEWNGQPGIRAPYLLIDDHDTSTSILDFYGKDWVLVTQDSEWKQATGQASAITGIECKFVHIMTAAKEETRIKFEALYGVTTTGAVLVRPDGFIAWKCESRGANAASELERALSQASFSARR